MGECPTLGRRSDDNCNESDQPENDGTNWPEPEHLPGGFPDRLSVSAWTVESDLSAMNVTTGLVDRLRNEYDHVIIAAPPVLSTITEPVLSESTDAVLLVTSVGITRWRDLSRAAEVLKETGAPLIGMVLVGQVNDYAAALDATKGTAPASEQ